MRAILVVLFMILTPLPAFASWPTNSAGYVDLSGGTSVQTDASVAATDGAGGAYVAWVDNHLGGPSLLFLNRVTVDGALAPGWPATGLQVAFGAPADQHTPSIVEDGAGGVFLTWLDLRNGASEVYATRITASATLAAGWTLGGNRITNTLSPEREPHVVRDGGTGCFLVWGFELSGSDFDIYATRLQADGTAHPSFAGGPTTVTFAGGIQKNLSVSADNAGNVLVAWEDYRTDPDADIYAQKVLATSGVAWATDGVSIATDPDRDIDPNILPLSGGQTGVFYLYALSLSSTGALWQGTVKANGTSPGATAIDSSQPWFDLVAISDGTGGAFVGATTLGATADIRVVRASASGSPYWPAGGTLLRSSVFSAVVWSLVRDGADGVVAVWTDFRNNADIYASRVSGTGQLLWPFQGVPVALAGDSQNFGLAVPDSRGGTIFSWRDRRNGSLNAGDVGQYASRLDGYGVYGDASPKISSVRDVANDQGGSVKVTWNRSYLDSWPELGVAQYRVWRSVPATLAQQMLANGARRIGPADALPTDGRRPLLFTTLAGQDYAWELAGAQTASYLVSYSLTVATTTDSMPGSNRQTAFLVQAIDGSGQKIWNSSPDSGYSVDNLPPATPAPFNGNYVAGTSTLNWGANDELDLAGYRLYRGKDPSFVPGPGNLVTALPDTFYTDPAGEPFYYKLVAVDTHGNVSPPALLLPSGTVDVPAPTPMIALALHEPWPIPARGTVRFTYALPRAEYVRLEILDVRGRRLAVPEEGLRDAGEHVVPLRVRLGSGVYVVRLLAEGRTLTQRLAIIE